MAKKEPYRIKPLNENKKNIIKSLIYEYDIETAEHIQEALKDLLGDTVKSMIEAEMTVHLGYEGAINNVAQNYFYVAAARYALWFQALPLWQSAQNPETSCI